MTKIKDAAASAETTLPELSKEEKASQEWLDKINAEAQGKANELSTILKTVVEPFVFVVEDLKDAAVGYFRKPDAKQSFKILRTMSENYDTGVELLARAQLIREADVQAHGFQGSVSDARFMNVDGKYEHENSELNLSLLMRAARLIKPFSNEFKKK